MAYPKIPGEIRVGMENLFGAKIGNIFEMVQDKYLVSIEYLYIDVTLAWFSSSCVYHHYYGDFFIIFLYALLSLWYISVFFCVYC